MKPSVGRIVIVVAQAVASNGVDRAPAIVNRCWSEGADTENGAVGVNLCAFPDCGNPVCLGSVPVYDSEDAARAAGLNDYFAFPPART